MTVAEQSEIEFELMEFDEAFPLRRDFTALQFDRFLAHYNFGLHFGPVLVDCILSIRTGKRIAYRCVMTQGGMFINRRASLARALVKRDEVSALFAKGLGVGGVH